jgi:hypothetical protein
LSDWYNFGGIPLTACALAWELGENPLCGLFPHTYVSVFLVVSFLLTFPPITYERSSFPSIQATCPTHFILFDFIILIILGEEYKS